jgi:integrator complex subunit 4
MCTARIIEPDEALSNENVIKVTAGLIAALPIHAQIDQLPECQRENLRIKIKYPDQNVHVVMPRMRDLKRVIGENGCELPNNWKLRTSVLLSHGIWTEPSQVDISICLSVKPSNELELCKPVKVTFSPKPIRKGI